MKRTFPKEKKFTRNVWKKKVKMKIYVICEGGVTEPKYLDAFAKEFGNGLVEVKPIGASGVPLTIVNKAIELTKELNRKAKDSFDKEFKVWGLLDVDDHPIIEAKIKARDNGIPLAISNPCFELWGLIHIKEHDKNLHRHDLQRLLSVEMPKYHHDKNPIFDYDLLRGKYLVAKERALRMIKRRSEEDNAEGNPSTNVHDLLDLVIENGKCTS